MEGYCATAATQPVPRMTHPHSRNATRPQSNSHSASLPQWHFPNLENYIAITGLPPLLLHIQFSIQCKEQKWWASMSRASVCSSPGGHKLQIVLDELPWDLSSSWHVKQSFLTMGTCSCQGVRGKIITELVWIIEIIIIFAYWVKLLHLNITWVCENCV